MEQDSGGCGQKSEPTPQVSNCGAKKPLLDPAEMRAWRAFLTASTLLSSTLNQEMEAALGISMHEYEILVRLSESPRQSMRMSTLADDVAHSRSRLTHTVRRLERDGYVERFSCPVDGRGVNCRLTETGAAFLDEAAPIHLAGVRRHLIDKLSSEQLTSLAEILETLYVPENTGQCGQSAGDQH